MYYYFIKTNGRLKIMEYETELDLRLNPSWIPLSDEQKEMYENNRNATPYEIFNNVLYANIVPSLEDMKSQKIMDIEMYDTSESVNGFYYDGIFMWLDKATRVGLVNMLNSAEILGQETVQIWYEQYNLTLTIQEARIFLAALEMYAAQCYNVTELHKREVNELETIESVEQYDITTGYPEQLHFESQNN